MLRKIFILVLIVTASVFIFRTNEGSYHKTVPTSTRAYDLDDQAALDNETWNQLPYEGDLPNPEVDTSTWSTYSSNDLGFMFEFRHPYKEDEIKILYSNKNSLEILIGYKNFGNGAFDHTGFVVVNNPKSLHEHISSRYKLSEDRSEQDLERGIVRKISSYTWNENKVVEYSIGNSKQYTVDISGNVFLVYDSHPDFAIAIIRSLQVQ